jgi:hypothetical protein
MTTAFPAHRIIQGDAMARTRPQGELVVTFVRDGEPPESRHVRNGKEAWASAVSLIARHDELRHGDVLTVARSD